MSDNKHLLEVEDLHVSFFTPAGEVKAVGGISYDLNYGEFVPEILQMEESLKTALFGGDEK